MKLRRSIVIVMESPGVDGPRKVNAADDWLIADSWQRCDLNLVESCNAVARSAKRPAWDRVLPNAVVAQTPSSETVNSLSTARTVSLYQVCEAISASTPTILGHAVGHEREQNSIRQRIQLDEIVVVRCSQTHGDAAVPV
jgi:hypothetical protein